MLPLPADGPSPAGSRGHDGRGAANRRSRFVTLQRIRVYATLIGATLWAVWLVDFSVPGVVDRLGKVKGTDFLQFYVGGAFVREGRLNALYDVQALYTRSQATIPGSSDTLYMPIQSPQTSLVFSPLAALPFAVAVTIWIAIILLLYAASCAITWRHCKALHKYRYETIACAIAFPGLYSTVLNGQTSIVSLLAVATALLALRKGWTFAAGLALGCLAFKPHWLLAAGALFFVAREWRVVAGASIGAAGQVAITTLLVGPAVMNAYWRTLLAIQRIGDLLEPFPGDSLRSFFKVLVPWPAAAMAAYVVAAAAVVWVAARIWRSSAPFEIRGASMVVAMLLISPHALPYDLILLSPVYFLLATWAADDPSRPLPGAVLLALGALFLAPLLGVLPVPLRLQFSATAMTVLLVWLWRAARPGDTRLVTG